MAFALRLYKIFIAICNFFMLYREEKLNFPEDVHIHKEVLVVSANEFNYFLKMCFFLMI